MHFGVPKEVKNHEYRVGLVPAVVAELTRRGHQVLVETNAGLGVGLPDELYQQAGAAIAADAAEVFARAEVVVKVKEPQAEERRMLRPGQVLFTYFHLAPDADQTADLVASGATCIAYETVTDGAGRLPLLAPMSEVAGRLSIQAGAACLEKARGGGGVLLGGVPGTEPGKVVIIGGGVVGLNAAQMAVGLGAHVVIMDRSLDVLRRLDIQFDSRIQTVYSSTDAISRHLLDADLVVGAVLVPGAAAPKLVSAEQIRSMRPGSVVVDVAIDQGGCFATSHATTHDAPTFVVDDVVHYCVANMPGAVARTSTLALNNATQPFVLALAKHGVPQALMGDAHFLRGLNVHCGQVTCREVAENLGYPYVDAGDLLASD